MDARVVAGGGGGAVASHAGHAVFASWLVRDPRLLYLPFAMGWDAEVLRHADAWMRSTFEPLGISRITTCFTMETLRLLDCDRYDGVYIGGGNTYVLVALLRESGAMERLRRLIADGRPLYGGSAGAVLLGATIATAEHLDENTVELTDERGLAVMAGHAVWPHYEEKEQAHVLTFARDSAAPTLAVPESGAVVWESGSACAVGSSVQLFQPDGDVATLPMYPSARQPASGEGGDS